MRLTPGVLTALRLCTEDGLPEEVPPLMIPAMLAEVPPLSATRARPLSPG